MKLRLLLTILLSLSLKGLFAQVDSAQMFLDTIEAGFKFQTGIITLKNGIGTVTVPKGFKYLNPEQSNTLLTTIWGNPPSETLGMLFPDDRSVFDKTSVAYNIQYNVVGYVDDDDADDINYDDLLEQMKKDVAEENTGRKQQGYEPVEFVGWGQPPFYDKGKKVLHWAQELKFGSNDVHTLNYNIRILGRKGVLEVNAISDMKQLAEVNKSAGPIIGAIAFADGYRYEQFDSKIDDVAAWTIGGLVAGKVLAKVGLWAVIAKFGKVILVAVAAFGAGVWRFITGKKKKEASETAALPGPDQP